MESNNIINLDTIYSMANFRGYKINLSMNLWIDEGKEYVRGRHSKRIKFQMDHAKEIHDWNFASMTLDGNVVEKTFTDKSIITAKEIKQVSNFTKNNAYALDKLADMLIDDDEWKEVMIKGGDPATQEQIEEQKRKVDEYILDSKSDNVLN